MDEQLHIETIELRRQFAELMLFGRMNYDEFNRLFGIIDQRFKEAEALRMFIQQKELNPEFEQFVTLNGGSD